MNEPETEWVNLPDDELLWDGGCRQCGQHFEDLRNHELLERALLDHIKDEHPADYETACEAAQAGRFCPNLGNLHLDARRGLAIATCSECGKRSEWMPPDDPDLAVWLTNHWESRHFDLLESWRPS